MAKSKEYGDSYLKHGAIMAAIFPDGITIEGPEQFNRYHLLLQAIIKITRYCQNWPGGHLDSVTDEVVYAAMRQALDEGDEDAFP